MVSLTLGSLGRSLSKKEDGSASSIKSRRPTHFPPTPFLHNHHQRQSTLLEVPSMTDNGKHQPADFKPRPDSVSQQSWRRDPFARQSDAVNQGKGKSKGTTKQKPKPITSSPQPQSTDSDSTNPVHTPTTTQVLSHSTARHSTSTSPRRTATSPTQPAIIKPAGIVNNTHLINRLLTSSSTTVGERARVLSRASSLDGLSLPPSVYSPSSTMTDLTDVALPEHLSRRVLRTPHSIHSPLSDAGYDSGSSAPGRRARQIVARGTRNRNRATDIMEEHGEDVVVEQEEIVPLRRFDRNEVFQYAEPQARRSRSNATMGSRAKAERMLGVEPKITLASAYICSGLGLMPDGWSYADSEASRGVQPQEDSMGLFWRPEVLGNAFAGDRPSDMYSTRPVPGKPAAVKIHKVHAAAVSPEGRHIPDGGKDAARLIIAKALKAAHPRDVEVVNCAVAPASTCHTFSFTIPRHDTLAAIARTRLTSNMTPGMNPGRAAYEAGFIETQYHFDPHGSATPQPLTRSGPDIKHNQQADINANEIRFYGATIMVWQHADKKRHNALVKLRNTQHSNGLGLLSTHPYSVSSKRGGSLRSVVSQDQDAKAKVAHLLAPHGGIFPIQPAGASKGRKKGERKREPLVKSGLLSPLENVDETDTASEAGTVSGGHKQDILSKYGIAPSLTVPPIKTFIELQEEEAGRAAILNESGDAFWVPVAWTIISRHPIYDTILDFLRIQYVLFKNDAYWHMVNTCRFLSTDTPRPGEIYRVTCGHSPKDEFYIESAFPGAVDFERGLVKVNYHLWPIFAAIDIDHILVALDVTMSQSGRIIFSSKYCYMLSTVVQILKYIVDLRGWEGVIIPLVHARDTSFVIEDPGPYIIGLPSELRLLVSIPADVVMIDIDTNSLICKSMPPVVTPKAKRDKNKLRLKDALGKEYIVHDRNVPMEYKVAFPHNCIRPMNFIYTREETQPTFIGAPVHPPVWWKHGPVMAALDRIMAEKTKKPTLIQRLTRSASTRHEAQFTAGEQVARVMMRRRALHYVESRDMLEIKMAKVNSRLLNVTHDSGFWKRQFREFEEYTRILAKQAEKLQREFSKASAEVEKLNAVLSKQDEVGSQLEHRLKATEDARAEAMRQLSDMHQSIQELEKEREQIMDVLEVQLNTAIEALPTGSIAGDSRASTPAESMFSSAGPPPARRSRARPTTRDSELSTMSRLTTGSQPLSVVGAMRQAAARYGGVGGGGGGGVGSVMTGDGLEGRMFERSEYISNRIAAIQAKLELALGAAHAGIGAPIEDHDDDDNHEADPEDGDETATEESAAVDQPVRTRASTSLGLTSATPSKDSRNSFLDPGDEETDTPTASRRKDRPRSEQIYPRTHDVFAPRTEPASAPDATNSSIKLNPEVEVQVMTAEEDPKILVPAETEYDLEESQDEIAPSPVSPRSQRASLSGGVNPFMKPGVGYRIRPKRRTSTASARSTSTQSTAMEIVLQPSDGSEHNVTPQRQNGIGAGGARPASERRDSALRLSAFKAPPSAYSSSGSASASPSPSPRGGKFTLPSSAGHGHGRLATASSSSTTTDGELLETPYGSAFIQGNYHAIQGDKIQVRVEEVDGAMEKVDQAEQEYDDEHALEMQKDVEVKGREADKRASVVSTATVTFG